MSGRRVVQQSGFEDDEDFIGNDYEDDDEEEEEERRPQLNMRHGFIREIIANQVERDEYDKEMRLKLVKRARPSATSVSVVNGRRGIRQSNQSAKKQDRNKISHLTVNRQNESQQLYIPPSRRHHYLNSNNDPQQRRLLLASSSTDPAPRRRVNTRDIRQRNSRNSLRFNVSIQSRNNDNIAHSSSTFAVVKKSKKIVVVKKRRSVPVASSSSSDNKNKAVLNLELEDIDGKLHKFSIKQGESEIRWAKAIAQRIGLSDDEARQLRLRLQSELN